MTDLNKTILQKASGETRLDPDQQRLYMGTFRERVLLTFSFEEALDATIADQFPIICQDLLSHYSPLFLKISPRLVDSLKLNYLKQAQQLGITVTIVDEAAASSPYALVFHTDYAVNLEDQKLTNSFTPKEKEANGAPKRSFWQKLFGN